MTYNEKQHFPFERVPLKTILVTKESIDCEKYFHTLLDKYVVGKRCQNIPRVYTSCRLATLLEINSKISTKKEIRNGVLELVCGWV